MQTDAGTLLLRERAANDKWRGAVLLDAPQVHRDVRLLKAKLGDGWDRRLRRLRGPVAGLATDGRDLVAENMGGRQIGRTQAAAAAVSYAATNVTDTGAAWSVSTGTPGRPGTGSGLVGRTVLVAGAAANSAPVAYGTIRDNTATVVSVDFWHDITNPATVATTPTGGAAGSGYCILPAAPPAFFMGLSIATRAFTAADPFLTNDGTTISEVFGASQTGLSRQLAAYAHTTGTATYTVSKTFTFGGSDSASVIAKVGVFAHGVTAAPTTTTTGVMLFDSLLGTTATLNLTGDNVAITDTVTVS